MSTNRRPEPKWVTILFCMATEPKSAGQILADAHRRGTPLALGGIYTQLKRMQDKHLVGTDWGERNPKTGRQPRLYFIKNAGREALSEFLGSQSDSSSADLRGNLAGGTA